MLGTALFSARRSDAERDVYAFIKEKEYGEVSPNPIAETNALARLLSDDPDVDALLALYLTSEHLKIATIDADPHSLPARHQFSTRG